MTRSARDVRWFGLTLGLLACLATLGLSAGAQVPAKKGASAKGKSRASAGKKGEAPPAAAGAAPSEGGDDKEIRFSRDVAPIFVGNCVGCHGDDQPKKQFSLASYRKLMNGGESGKVILPKDAAKSLLIQHVKGEDGLRKMPPGNQRTLAPATIETLAKWIDAGAVLDAGVDADAPIRKIAPSPEDRRRAEIAKLSTEDRDKKIEETGRGRWAKATTKTTPEVVPGKNFLVFSNLPKKRAEAVEKALEAQKSTLSSILGPAAAALNGPEKISVYVFNERATFVEFLRAVESREADSNDEAAANMLVESPYLVAIDPLNGRDEAPSSRRKSKKGDDSMDAPERSLIGLLAEPLGVAATNAAGKPPKWLSLGLGAFLSEQVDGRSVYFRRLHEAAARNVEVGWTPKSNEALGGEGDAESVRAMGLTLVEFLSSQSKATLSGFSRRMLQGQEQLDETIKEAFGASREQFIDTWGTWVAGHHPMRRGR